MWEKLIELLLILLYPFAGIGTFAIIIFIAWLFHPEKIEKCTLLLNKLCAYISERHERRYISKHIEYNINEKGEQLCKESHGIIPYKIKIEWVNIDNIESYLQNNALIIKMRNHKNQSKNFAIAVREYVPCTLIPLARKYVNPPLMKAIDYVISKCMLAVDTRALSYFIDMYEKEFKESKTENLIKEVDRINEQGLLTRVLLSEYKKLGGLYPSDPRSDMYNETQLFEKKLYDLVVKKPEEKVSPSLLGNYIRAAIVPVAKEKTLEEAWIEPHLIFIQNSLKKGMQTFYIIAAGEYNITLAKYILKEAINKFNLKEINKAEYSGIFRDRRIKMFLGILETL